MTKDSESSSLYRPLFIGVVAVTGLSGQLPLMRLRLGFLIFISSRQVADLSSNFAWFRFF